MFYSSVPSKIWAYAKLPKCKIAKLVWLSVNLPKKIKLAQNCKKFAQNHKNFA